MAIARNTARRTIGPETFKLESRSLSDSSYGQTETFTETIAAMPARLKPVSAQTTDQHGRVIVVRMFVLIVPRTVVVKEGDRVTRNSDNKIFFVTGVEGPQTDDAVVKTLRLEKEVKVG